MIPIGNSSSGHGVSDNESSSFERLMVLSHVGEGTFHLRSRAQPPASSLDGESIPITMILPSFVSRGERRSDGGDVSASPVCGIAIVLAHHCPPYYC